MSLSPAEQLAVLPEADRFAYVAAMSERDVEALLADWRFWARPEQLPPDGDWTTWGVIAGRGFGKTRTGAEWVLDRAVEWDRPASTMRGVGSRLHRVALVGRAAADVRDVMIEGESGLAEVAARRGIRLDYQPGRRRVKLPELGTVMHTYSAMEPNSLRGPQHHTGWGDEPSAWRMVVDAQGNTAWSNLLLGMRLGNDPRVVATMTPKPVPVVRELIERAAAGTAVRVTSGSLYDNLANLAAAFVDEIVGRYAGTRLAAQEILGLLLEGVEGASWQPDDIAHVAAPEAVTRIVVGVDPPGGTVTECGIVVVGLGARHEPGATKGSNRRAVYVLDDMSLAGRPEVWGAQVVAAVRKWRATKAVVERNHGGDMCRAVIHAVDPTVIVDTTWASTGKRVRAEPVALVYQQGRGRHVGWFPELESEMVNWTDDESWSPNRMDALVWAVTDLLGLATTPRARTHRPTARVPTGAAAAARQRPAR